MPQRVAGQRPRRRHHLFLINQDPVGFGTDLLQQRVFISELGFSLFPLHILVDQVHRAGPVEGDQRDQVLDPLEIEDRARPSHARRLHLEHADVFGPVQELVGFFVIQGDLLRPHLLAGGLLNQPQTVLDHRQCLQPQEVHFQQSDVADLVHRKLRHHRPGIVPRQRQVVREVPIGDHHPGGVGSTLPHHAL